ncbi:hypothetical protein ZWY2020_047000 [Hordeum vulgare]|nr:hypothetical protein ZWY2020_047000 [Hordeum vulgare]
MGSMATARDVEEVVQKLASDCARPHDEGVKMLGTWLQGGRALTFCRLLARNTVRATPAQLASGTPTSHLSACFFHFHLLCTYRL